MVKTTGPALSLDALGSIGKAIAFSKTKGRSYLKYAKRPRDPKSSPQLGMRSMFAFTSAEWKDLSAGQQASYDDLAAAAQITAFNAYKRYNQERWTRYAMPAQVYPASESAQPAVIAFASHVVRNRLVTFTAFPSIAGINWGLILYRSTSFPYTPTPSLAVRVSDWSSGGNGETSDQPPGPGTYYYRLETFSVDGNTIGPWASTLTAVIT